MSQAKVDRYKKEKKNREKQIKKKKIVKSVWVIAIALFIGACIGYPLGKKLYKVTAKHRKANETVTAMYYDAWMSNYWNNTYGGKFGFTEEQTEDATYTDAEEDASSDENDDVLENETPTDAD